VGDALLTLLLSADVRSKDDWYKILLDDELQIGKVEAGVLDLVLSYVHVLFGRALLVG
jgi:hypothetical protein